VNDALQYEPGIYGLETESGFGESSLADVISRLLDAGVVLKADVVISLAGVDLVYLGLNALLCSSDRKEAESQLQRT
jgi:Gas vesicle protein